VRIEFANFGEQPPGSTACDEYVGQAQVAYLSGAGLWRTAKGLLIGNSLARLRALYPSASRHGISWWLISRKNPFGSGRAAVLSAYVVGGRVTRFRAVVGAAGE
jgi:hypothetical protein